MFPFIPCLFFGLFFAVTSLLADPDPCVCPLPTVSSPLPYERHNGIPMRVQWNNVGGYCGEMSLISAGLYYGQYASQYEVRADGNSANSNSQDNELLLKTVDDPDGSEVTSAATLLLTVSSYPANTTSSAQDFLTWVKGQVIAGNPVAIGVYMNQTLYDTGVTGDHTYDHIVLVTGVGSNHPLSTPATYYDEDVLYFWDNGLWYLNEGDLTVAGYSSSPFGALIQNRADANAAQGNLYSVPIPAPVLPASTVLNYGVAFTGAQASSPHLALTVAAPICEVPVILDTSTPEQEPVKPAATPLTLTITVTSPPVGNVNVYMYNDLRHIPTGHFNQNASLAAKSWLNVNPATPITDLIQSDGIAIYRAVKVLDP